MSRFGRRSRNIRARAFFDPKPETSHQEPTIAAHSLHRERGAQLLTLLRQTIHDLRSGTVAGYEILLPHPRDTLHLASASGTLLELDQFILKTAHKMAKESPDKLIFVNTVSESLCAGVLPFAPEDSPSNLVLEITERGHFDELEVRNWLGAYRAQGLKVALDDFGTGHNPFSRYSTILPDYLKLNWMDHQDTLRAAIAFAKNLHAQIVMERIETREQDAWVRKSGIAYVQGFHYGRPEAVAL
jgi:EAL domain-containing protein (putative c-di-GMP-specific phosphodiesterase class I)